MSKHERDLTRYERAAIQKLVTEMCANYDSDCGCLPLDCACYMLNKWQTCGYCRYFQSAVLPLDPVLEASLLGRAAPLSDLCTVCGKPFTPNRNQTYCSSECQVKGNRQKSRERMERMRKKHQNS